MAYKGCPSPELNNQGFLMTRGIELAVFFGPLITCSTAQAAVLAGYEFDDGAGTATTVVTVADGNIVASDYKTGAGLVTLTDTSANSLAEIHDAEETAFGTANQVAFGGARANFGLAITENDFMTFSVTPITWGVVPHHF